MWLQLSNWQSTAIHSLLLWLGEANVTVEEMLLVKVGMCNKPLEKGFLNHVFVCKYMPPTRALHAAVLVTWQPLLCCKFAYSLATQNVVLCKCCCLLSIFWMGM